MRRALLAGLAAIALGGPGLAQPIDRHALVSRHDIRLTKVDPSAPLMVGNGQIGFTADITGLQTFPEAYSKIAPLLTEAQWAWHSFPNPNGYTYADGTTPIDVRGTKQPYAYMIAASLPLSCPDATSCVKLVIPELQAFAGCCKVW